MKAFEIQEFGLENLKLVDRDVPKPGHRQVLVRMTAASLNFRDLMVVRGDYNPKMRRPMVPLSDGSGIVEEVGPEVTRWKSGDRVTGIFMQNWLDGPPRAEHRRSSLGGSLDGILAEYVTFDQDGLVCTPAFLSDSEAACLPCAAVTAWNAVFEQNPPAPGDTVLLQGTGGVSLFALQLAHAAGLNTILTSSSDEKLERARQMGATETINYKTKPDWDVEARRLTDNRGVDLVIEVGGTVDKSLKAVRIGGAISLIGTLAGKGATFDPTAVLMNSIRLRGIYVGSRSMFERLIPAIKLHSIRPVVDRVFAWTDCAEALRVLEKAGHFGKIALSF